MWDLGENVEYVEYAECTTLLLVYFRILNVCLGYFMTEAMQGILQVKSTCYWMEDRLYNILNYTCFKYLLIMLANTEEKKV